MPGAARAGPTLPGRAAAWKRPRAVQQDDCQPGAVFDGLTLVPPGIVLAFQWRPGNEDTGGEPAQDDGIVCGVGFKQ